MAGQRAIGSTVVARLFPPQVRVVVAGPPMFERPLFAEEASLVRRAVPARRREFTAGRNAARAALGELGYGPAPILRRDDRAPAWPAGAAGSITHCAGFVCAVAARSDRFASLGIDAEKAGKMERGLEEMICCADELARFAALPEIDGADWPTIAFSAKEATYKCLSPLLGELLDFKDVSLRLVPDETCRRGGFDIDPGSAYPGLCSFGLTGAWILAERLILCGAHIAKANPGVD